MVFVLDAFLDFVMFAVVCVRRGPNVDLTVGKTVDTQGFRHPGKKKAYPHENDLESRKSKSTAYTAKSTNSLILQGFFSLSFLACCMFFPHMTFCFLGTFFRITLSKYHRPVYMYITNPSIKLIKKTGTIVQLRQNAKLAIW